MTEASSTQYEDVDAVQFSQSHESHASPDGAKSLKHVRSYNHVW